MAIQISGKRFDLGEAMRTHILDRIDAAVGKYFDGGVSGHVVVDHEGTGYRTDCTLHLSSGITLQAEGRAHEPYPSFDQAAERLEKRLRRYKRRLKDHQHGGQHGSGRNSAAMETVANYVLEAPDEEAEDIQEYNAVVIAEQASSLKTLTVAGAVMELDMTGSPVIVFRHGASGRVNVVYRRGDGNVGWVDPGAAGR